MIQFYDCEVFQADWLFVFKRGETYTEIYNNVNCLKDYVNAYKKDIFVGYNNQHYDDIILAATLLHKNPYAASQSIIYDKERPRYQLNLVTMDVMSELPMGTSLKACQGNLGMAIFESPVDFRLDRPLTADEMSTVIDYCRNDIDTTEDLFYRRSDYFTSKFEIVKEFNLQPKAVGKTRAILSSYVLDCSRPDRPTYDRLYLDYDPHIDWNLIPGNVREFFEKCEYDYRCGTSYETIEARKLDTIFSGIPHTVAFGGLHGALEKYVDEGTYLLIDISSYYPSLIINNNFISRNSQQPDKYRELYRKRLDLKAAKDPKADVYKIILNATYGAMKSEYNSLFDPRQANNICVNGQLILIELIKTLEGRCKLIQSNTDGILVKYDDLKLVENSIEFFEKKFNLKCDRIKVRKVAQRDVNNYAIELEDGTIKAKGRLAKYNGGSFEQNSLSIIDKCLVNWYIKKIPIETTIMSCYQNNDLLPFQIIAKGGATYDGMYYEYGPEGETEYIETQKVNRVFATNDHLYWGIYKRKGESYQKIANTAEHNIVFNGEISLFEKSKLDLDYYVSLCRKNLWG